MQLCTLLDMPTFLSWKKLWLTYGLKLPLLLVYQEEGGIISVVFLLLTLALNSTQFQKQWTYLCHINVIRSC